jgi:hypothetical protein
VIKYDVSGVEPSEDRPLIPVDVYTCKLVQCLDAKPSGKDRRLELIFEIVSGDYKGQKLYEYVVLNEASEWKLAEFIRSLGLKDKGNLDPNKILGTLLSVKTKIETSDAYGSQARVARMMLLKDGESADAEDLSEDGEGDGEPGGEDEAWTEEELNELSLKELTEQATEFELDPAEIQKGKKTAAQKKTALVAAILEAQEAEEPEGEEGEEGAEGEEGEEELWTEEELEALDDDELKAVMAGDAEDEEDEGFGLDPDDDAFKTAKKVGKKTLKKFDRAKAIAGILEVQGEGEGEGGDEVAYEDMELADLKALCTERGLPTRGPKRMLVERLNKADEPV